MGSVSKEEGSVGHQPAQGSISILPEGQLTVAGEPQKGRSPRPLRSDGLCLHGWK